MIAILKKYDLPLLVTKIMYVFQKVLLARFIHITDMIHTGIVPTGKGYQDIVFSSNEQC